MHENMFYSPFKFLLSIFIVFCVTQITSSSSWSHSLGRVYLQCCWYTAQLDQSCYAYCTCHSNWEEFGACHAGLVIFKHHFSCQMILNYILTFLLWKFGNQLAAVFWFISVIGCWFNFLTLIYIGKFYVSVLSANKHYFSWNFLTNKLLIIFHLIFFSRCSA